MIDCISSTDQAFDRNDKNETKIKKTKKTWQLRNDLTKTMNLLFSLLHVKNEFSILTPEIKPLLAMDENDIDDEFHNAINNFGEYH